MAQVLPRRLAPVLPTTYSPSLPMFRQPQASDAVRPILDLAKASSKRESTLNSFVTLACIAKFSRLLRPVGPGFLSQNPSPGFLSQGPYRLSACQDCNTAIQPEIAVVLLWQQPNRPQPHPWIQRESIPAYHIYPALAPVSRDYSRPKGRLATCY